MMPKRNKVFSTVTEGAWSNVLRMYPVNSKSQLARVKFKKKPLQRLKLNLELFVCKWMSRAKQQSTAMDEPNVLRALSGRWKLSSPMNDKM
jgi:hypothetical protein